MSCPPNCVREVHWFAEAACGTLDAAVAEAWGTTRSLWTSLPFLLAPSYQSDSVSLTGQVTRTYGTCAGLITLCLTCWGFRLERGGLERGESWSDEEYLLV